MLRSVRTAAFVVCCAGLVLAGCNSNVKVGTTPSVSQSDLEQGISNNLYNKYGERPTSVSCPGDLQALKGKTMRCDITGTSGKRYGATVTIQSYTNGHARYSVQVDSTPEN